MSETKGDKRAPAEMTDSNQDSPPIEYSTEQAPKLTFMQKVKREFCTWGSAVQIVIAALLAIAIGLVVSTQVDDVPEAASTILNIPGNLWLRALQAVVLPLIICAMILAVVQLRDMGKGSGRKIASWTVGFYLTTTILSTILSTIMTAFVWGPMFTVIDTGSLDVSESQQEDAEEKTATGASTPPHVTIQTLFQSFVPSNVFASMANTELLAVLMTAIVLGALIRDKNGVFYRLIVEVEEMIMRVILFLVKLAPIGVFSLILSNLMTLNMAQIGTNLGLLIGGTVTTICIHVFVLLPILFFIATRMNPYAYWLKNSPAWITAWGSASSAGTLPVTMRCLSQRGIPITVYKFTAPLGCLVNMDGTAIYFPMGVVFLAGAQGITLGAGDYVLIVILAVVSSIGTTPIPSASLVLIVMIAESVGVEAPGILFAVIVAIDWLLDRFRTATNVSGDLYGSMIVYKVTGIEDPDDEFDDNMAGDRRDSV